MNYPAMRWAVEECLLEGAAKPILFVIAYRADRDTGECWAGQRRIAREAGVDPRTVERVIPRLIKDGVLELVDQPVTVPERRRGPKPNCYRIALDLVEGPIVGEVIHRPAVNWFAAHSRTADTVIHSPGETADIASAIERRLRPLLPTSEAETADIGPPKLPTSGDLTADMTSPLTSENGGKVLNFKVIDQREVQVVGGDSTADAVAADAYDPYPEVDEKHKAYLRERFGPKSKSGQEQEQPTAAGTGTAP